MRNVGMHAGGVLIAPGRITDFLPAVHATGQRERGEPVRQGRRRSDRPGQVRLPRPGDPDHSRAGKGLHRRTPPRAGRLFVRRSAARRREGLPALFRGPDRVGVPVRKRRHAAHAEGRQAEPPRRPDRAQRHVPTRARWRTIPSFCARKHGREDVELSASAARDRARRDLRHHGLPGAGDAGGAGSRRLFAGRRRPAAPRDGQEEARGDGDHRAIFREGAAKKQIPAEVSRRSVRPDGEICRLRL